MAATVCQAEESDPTEMQWESFLARIYVHFNGGSFTVADWWVLRPDGAFYVVLPEDLYDDARGGNVFSKKIGNAFRHRVDRRHGPYGFYIVKIGEHRGHKAVPARPTQSQLRRPRRLERYGQVVALFNSGQSQATLSSALGIERKTIRRWLRRREFPERKPPHRRPPKVNEFGTYLQQRWNESCHKCDLSVSRDP